MTKQINFFLLLTLSFFSIVATCRADVNITSLSISPQTPVQAGVPVTVTAGASSSSADTLYYKFYYRGNYGTAEYDTSPWITVQGYSTLHYAQYNFPAAGDYIVVVRVVEDPSNEPQSLPITGQVISVIDSDTEQSSLTLTKGSAVELASSSNFAGIVFDGSHIIVSYGKQNDLFVRSFDTDFQAVSEEMQITSVADVTDHKHIYVNNEHYIIYSTIGDDALYLFKLDSNLQPTGSVVTVTEDSTTTKTNDMLLASDGTTLFAGQYRPSDLNNFENSGHLIKRYDTNLNALAADVTANDHSHVNTASLIFIAPYFYLIAPSTPVVNGLVDTERDLILVRYDSSWTVIGSSSLTLVESSAHTHTSNGDGIWMSTGAAYDTQSNSLLVGYTFADGAQGSDNGNIYLRVFNGTTLAQTHFDTISSSGHANRAHFLLVNDTLYVVYDDNTSGSPVIYGLKYTITRF